MNTDKVYLEFRLSSLTPLPCPSGVSYWSKTFSVFKVDSVPIQGIPLWASKGIPTEVSPSEAGMYTQELGVDFS